MNKLHVRKQTDSFVIFSEGQRLYAGSSYEVRVDAPEFRDATDAVATLSLCSGSIRLATCALTPDPLRRGVRQTVADSPLAIPAWRETSLLELRVELGGDTIILVDATVIGNASGDATVVPRWTVTDLGTVDPSVPVVLANMAQVKLSAAAVALPLHSLSLVPPEGDLDAYVVVTVPAGSAAVRFPFSGVLVGGTAPVWSHQDSLLLPSRKWILRIVKVADDYYADLRAGRPGGTEIDPDGAAVVSAEVNR